MGFLKASDTINGQEGRAFAKIGTQTEEMFYVKKLSADVKKKKTDIYTLGKRGVQHKAAGWEGKGKMTIYYVTSVFRKIMLDYMKDGKDVYFDITVTNEDPTSKTGFQTITLKDVNLNSVPMTLINVESEVMDEEIEFTFEGVEMDKEFNTIN